MSVFVGESRSLVWVEFVELCKKVAPPRSGANSFTSSLEFGVVLSPWLSSSSTYAIVFLCGHWLDKCPFLVALVAKPKVRSLVIIGSLLSCLEILGFLDFDWLWEVSSLIFVELEPWPCLLFSTFFRWYGVNGLSHGFFLVPLFLCFFSSFNSACKPLKW